MNETGLGQTHLQAILEFQSEGIIYQRSDGKILLFNKAAQQIFGLSEEEAYGRTSTSHDWHLVYPDGSPCRGEEHPSMKTLRTGVALNNEIRGIAIPNRPITWISINTRPIMRPDGDLPEAVIISFSDITERKDMEDVLREREESYRTIFQNAPLGIFKSTIEGQFIKVNKALTEMLGFSSPEDLLREIKDIGKQIYVRSEDRMNVVSKSAASKDVSRYVNRYRRRDGTEFIANLVLKTVRDNAGQPSHLEGIVEDITERKQAEESLKKSEEAYRFLAQNTPDVIWMTDLNFQTTYTSPSVETKLGYTPEERKRQPFEEAVTSESFKRCVDALAQEIRRDKAGADPDRTVSLELEYFHKNGSTVWMENSVKAIRNADGEMVGLHGVSRDITERKRAEKVLAASEANYRTIFNASNDAIIVHSIQNGAILDANQAMLEMYGFSKEEASNLTLDDVSSGVAPYTLKGAENLINKVITEGPQLFEWHAKKKTGELFWVEVNLKQALIT